MTEEYITYNTSEKTDMIGPSVTVIIPTTYSRTVFKAYESVCNQTASNVRILLVVDGPDWPTPRHAWTNTDLLVLPWNTGGNGFYGHRIYAALPHLINTDYIAFLDQDNWYEENHIESLKNVIESKDLAFAHSFRKIHDKDGKYLIDDNCESLGRWPVWPVLDAPKGEYHPSFAHLVDTSSYLFRTDFLIKTCHIWHNKWGGDRNYFHQVKEAGARYDTSKLHTLHYRLDGNPNSVTKEFFEKGNQKQLEYYNGDLPWEI